ncbi:MAG: AraC-like DNA-binding protein [Limisphaerales bacterium]|jgi:AraC-like DNA-binding protein
MKSETFNIRGMVCTRCIKVLDSEFTALGATVSAIELGKVELSYDPEILSQTKIRNVILENGFEIIENKDGILAEETKREIINYVQVGSNGIKLSTVLSEKQNVNYKLLSRNFSKIFGKTIERFFLQIKIEQVKEWIENGEGSFGEIAIRLGYHNLSALSRQFKIETGMTMKEYKNKNDSDRIPLDKL